MARKTLLTEAQIRSFIKLANLGQVGETKIQEWTEEEAIEEQEEELEMDAEEEELPGEDLGGLPDLDAEGGLEMDAELDDEEVGMDAELGAPDELDAGVGGDKESEFMDLVQQLADLVGVEVDMEGGAEAGAEDEVADLEGGEESGEELPPLGDEEEAPLGGEEEIGLEDAEEEEPPGMRDVYENKDKIVNEVARRVVARLAEQDKNSKMVDELAERIFNRLTSK